MRSTCSAARTACRSRSRRRRSSRSTSSRRGSTARSSSASRSRASRPTWSRSSRRRSGRAGRRSRSRTRRPRRSASPPTRVLQARGGRRAGRRRDQDLRQLARRGRVDLRRRRPATRSALAELRRVPDQLARAARPLVRATSPRSTRSAEIDGGTVIARGINYGTSFEIALKIRELSGPPLRGVLGGRPDARPGRGDRARLAGVRASLRPGRRSTAMADGDRGVAAPRRAAIVVSDDARCSRTARSRCRSSPACRSG